MRRRSFWRGQLPRLAPLVSLAPRRPCPDGGLRDGRVQLGRTTLPPNLCERVNGTAVAGTRGGMNKNIYGVSQRSQAGCTRVVWDGADGQ